MKFIYTLFLFIGYTVLLNGQSATVFGRVTDISDGKGIDFVTVYQEGTANATETDKNGFYSLKIPASQATVIIVSRIGYKEAKIELTSLPSESNRNVNFKLIAEESDLNVIITGSRIEDLGMVKEEITEMRMLPTTTGNLESVLPSIALGVSSGSGGELSSQYNVRGGNYDENLIYVNDFEIFRPQLIRSGQQEGLTFPNPDLIKDLSFSSGGFESRYGDKMSSVLDIKYKRPSDSKGSISASMLGINAHFEGSKRIGQNAYNKLRFLGGARYKTNRNLLGSLDTKGEYSPDFLDVQGYVTYDLTRSFQLGAIGNYNLSRYNFVPQDRSTALGLINFALRLSSVFEGSERDEFIQGMGGLSLTYIPVRDKNPFYVKLLASIYGGEENEQFDIIGRYRLAQIETSLGSDEFGTEVAVLGSGTQHNYARNYLYNTISNVQLKGGVELNKNETNSNFIQWGIKFQNEDFDDNIREWERLDSAGYSLPYSEEEVLLQSFISTQNEISNQRFSGYLQNSFTSLSEGEHELKINAGIRAKYSSLNSETIFSPRMQVLYKPLSWSSDISFKLAGGVYYQTPLYREMRRIDGTVNEALKSQKSIHLVGGISYDFLWKKISNQPFRLISELYYKKLSNLTTYDIDNVKIRYTGENDASGYVAGLDLRINGEFVPGAESWVNLSFLTARESIEGVQHLRRERGDTLSTEVGNVPRPTDRFFTLAMFFQDYLPSNDRFKMNLNFSFGSGLPFGLRGNNIVYRNTYRFKAYHRVDIGFAYQIFDKSRQNNNPGNPFSFSENAWLSLEVFNLLDVSNVVSNTWIKTITNTQYAIPNFLTSRRLNLRFRVDF
jgi:hypothetical protein